MKKHGFSAPALLSCAAAVEQAIAFGVSVINARLYAPEEIGLYMLLVTAESLFGGVLGLRYEAMVVTSPKKREALVYGKMALMLVGVFAVVCGVGYGAVCFVGSEGAVWFGLSLVVLLFLRGVMNVLGCMANRDMEYGLIASAQICRVVAQGAVGMALGLCGFGAWGLVMAHGAGLALGVFRQRKLLFSHWKEMRTVTHCEVRTAMRAAYKQPLFATPAVFANRLSYSVITLTISRVFGEAALGFYSMANKAMTLPLEIFSRSAGKVFFREAGVEKAKTGRFAKSFCKTSLLEGALSLVVCAVCYAVAPWAFSVMYGEAWRVCGEMVRLMMPMLCVRMITSAVAQGFQVAGKQRLELALHCLMAVFSAALYGYALAEKALDSYLNGVTWVFSAGYAITYLCLARLATKKQ